MGLLESGLWPKVLATHQIPFLLTEIPVEKSVALITFVSLPKRNYVMTLCRLRTQNGQPKPPHRYPRNPEHPHGRWEFGQEHSCRNSIFDRANLANQKHELQPTLPPFVTL